MIFDHALEEVHQWRKNQTSRRLEKAASVSSAAQNREIMAAMTERQAAARRSPATDETRSTWRPDEQLLALLDKPARWTGHDTSGTVLFAADTLRSAVEMATGSVVTVAAICRKPDDSLIVFHPQIEMLATAIRSPPEQRFSRLPDRPDGA